MGKINITITLEVKEIIFDIQNKTFLTGRSREADKSKDYESASHIQAGDDEENSYQIRRSLTSAYGDLRTQLAEYLTTESTQADNLITQAIDNDTQLTLQLAMPGNYNKAATDTLGSALHRYLVNRAVADWFTITNKADAPDYAALANQDIESVKRALYKRKSPSRPQIRPTSTI